ncbi:tetratricopeptide repeat-containing glycosyltransferase [Thiothrix winogradskyi]|uniref:Glycosyltransferase n=1 Tax=Thiothrix winogradskyi TaxID=96472 RepID=A0ABY3T3Y3_9GAMM|nr:glycosyltransferase [Thiothrix winogradskyi]UJS25640.1 glycosyltransferase [Thiothrix winogradskyi]
MIEKPSICLNMIVKNESKVITRCLDSVKDMLDYWVISDTGSTDGTQQIIRDYFAQHGIDGILLENEWQNFGYNRNLALQQALGKADYILIMDADDQLIKTDAYRFNNLAADRYLIKMHREGITYYFPKLINGTLPWYWEGVLHEYLYCYLPYTSAKLSDDCQIHSTTDGARSQNPHKYLDDARILEKALETEPHNDRYQFYLAQSYRDAGYPEKALTHYQKRVTMGGWHEEVYYSLLEVAHHKSKLDHPLLEVLDAYVTAYHYRPQRLEALCEAVRICRINKHYRLGYQLGSTAKDTPLPNDVLFLDPGVYHWQFIDELSICAIYTGQLQQATDMLMKLLDNPQTPDDQKPRIENNLKFAQKTLDRHPIPAIE